jgi:glycosyltransferase involved in cell wall biosynthesis
VPEERIALVTNGVNPFYYAPASDAALSAVCRDFGLPWPKDERIPVCFFLANHTNNKGLGVLMEAFLQSERPYTLVVGGKKRPHIGYDEYVARCRPGQRIVFTDSLSDEQVRALFHYADLFVFPSLADTLPLVVLEAMAAGLPILSTTVGGIPYQVDASCGRLVPPGDAPALRAAFEDLTADPVALRALGAAARLRVQARFDWERSAAEAYRHYQAIVAEAPA